MGILASYLSQMPSGVRKFLSALVITTILTSLKSSTDSVTRGDDIEKILEIVKGLHIPPNKYDECVRILSQFSQTFK